MPMRSVRAALLALPALAAGLVLIAVSGGGAGTAAQTGAGWSGLAGGPRPRVALGQRMIVVLRSASLADRVARAGGLATEGQERRWTAAALAPLPLCTDNAAMIASAARYVEAVPCPRYLGLDAYAAAA